MVCLYITSSKEAAGKTTVCAGLGRLLQKRQQKVGFFKPIIARGKQPAADHDAIFMKQILGLTEQVENVSPFIGEQDGLASRIKEAYSLISPGKDVIIAEGAGELGTIQALSARVIAVEEYFDQLSGKSIERYIQGYKEHLLGVVLNKVPLSKVGQLHDEMTAQLKGTGIALLGVLPEDRQLLALTVGELAEVVGGEVLVSKEKLSQLVENVMLGVMTVDPATEYFSRKKNKAVVVRANRPDMQLAALETSTRCLVICTDTPLAAAVRFRAEAKNVPVISTKDDIIATVGKIENALVQSRFSQEAKLPRLAQIVEQSFNLQSLRALLGIAG